MVFSAHKRETGEALLQRDTTDRVCADQTEKRGFRLGRLESRCLRHAQCEHREGSKTVGRCAETGAEGGKAFSVQDEAAQTFLGAKA